MTQSNLDWCPVDPLVGFGLLANPIMIADFDMIIRYVNNAAIKMFQLIEADIRQDLPHFRATEVLDKSIDYFHKNPAFQRGIMHGLSKPHDGKFTVGGKSLAFRTTPNFDDKGDLKCYLVEWQDLTILLENKRQIETLISRVQTMAVSHSDGNISVRMDSTDLSDEFVEVAEQVNEMVTAHISTKRKVIACLNAFAQGDFDHVFENFSGDRAFISDAIEAARAAFKNVVEEIEDLSRSIEEGALDRSITPEAFKGDYRKIIEAFDRSYLSLNMTIGNINTQISEISGAIGEVNSSAAQLSSASQSQASAVEEISSTIEQTEQMVRASAEASDQMRDVVVMANGLVGEGIETVTEMTEAMHHIRSSSSEIAKIIKVIDEIAFQTNLLALNAAVEAARAGEHGRGFAVVAQEVRNLAARSAKAAKETGDLIKLSGESVQRGVIGSEATEQAFRRISDEVQNLEEIAIQIATGAKEQSQGVSQISSAATSLARNGLDVSSQSEELASAAAQMDAAAGAVRNTMSRFKLRAKIQANGSADILSHLNPLQRDQIMAFLKRSNMTAH